MAVDHLHFGARRFGEIQRREGVRRKTANETRPVEYGPSERCVIQAAADELDFRKITLIEAAPTQVAKMHGVARPQWRPPFSPPSHARARSGTPLRSQPPGSLP